MPFSQYTDFHGYSLNSRSSSIPQYGTQDLWDLSELLTYGFPIVLKQFPHLEYLPLLITSSLSFKAHFQAHLFHETFSDHSISPSFNLFILNFPFPRYHPLFLVMLNLCHFVKSCLAVISQPPGGSFPPLLHGHHFHFFSGFLP